MLVFAIGFNLWLYRLEPTATLDPNDNTFQYALVLRTNEVWDFADKICPHNLAFSICHLSFLTDHWVPNWAQGYNLPFYYSHVPQIMIVASYRLISLLPFTISLFTYYHLVIYLLLCFFPLSVFLALRVINPPAGGWLAAGFGALIATHISTDGLYGLDPPSFLWRGYGLSSQLFGMIWLPMAIAYSWRFLVDSSQWTIYSFKTFFATVNRVLLTSNFLLAILFLVFTAMGHLGLGIIAILGVGALAISRPVMLLIERQPIQAIFRDFRQILLPLLLLVGTTIFFLSYWVIPILLNNNYHNNSFWDPIWKFNSYPWKETLTRLFNGELFDFGRFPIFTGLVGLGFFASLSTSYRPFAFLFIIYIALYFGRTTWGGLIDLIPGMADFHISRFIVGLHLAGLFLAPIGVAWMVEKLSAISDQLSATRLHSFIRLPARNASPARQSPDGSSRMADGQRVAGGFVYLFISLLTIATLYPQTIRYNELNDTLIIQANNNYAQWKTSETKLFDALQKRPPGRIYVGRGANWGKKFEVADVTMFVHISTYGFPTVLWLPETWSPSSDVEQYFVDEWPEHFDLLNLNTVVAPPEVKPLQFWKLEQTDEKWKRYSVPTSGYFTPGVRVATVSTTRDTFINVVHLWLQSDNVKKGWFPQLSFLPLPVFNTSPLPAFGMVDETTYKTRDNTLHNLFAEKPVYLSPQPTEKRIFLTGPESVTGDMIFKTKVHVPENCTECLLILKQTYHPNWKAYVDSKPVETFTVFPFLTAIKMETAGDYTVEFHYEPSGLKIFLMTAEGLALVALFLHFLSRNFARKRLPHHS